MTAEKIWCTGTKIFMHWRELILNVMEIENDD
jgi:hypothetical protein